MKSKSAEKIKLTSYDDLFGTSGQDVYIDAFEPTTRLF